MIQYTKASLQWILDMSVAEWRLAEQSITLAATAYKLPAGITIVEVGAAMGRDTLGLGGRPSAAGRWRGPLN